MNRLCEQCGAAPIKRGRSRFCSRACQSRWQAETKASVPITSFHTPVSTKAERVRANGLINMRLRRGQITKPTHCDNCRSKKRLDSHHPDYQQPDLVAWLCRSCHMRCHSNRILERYVATLARHARAGTRPLPPSPAGRAQP